MEETRSTRAGGPSAGDLYAVSGVLALVVVSVLLQVQGLTGAWPWPAQVLVGAAFFGFRADPVQRALAGGDLSRRNGRRTALGCAISALAAWATGVPELTGAFCAVVVAVHVQWGHARALHTGAAASVAAVGGAVLAVHLGVVSAVTGPAAALVGVGVLGLGLAVVGNLAVLAGQEQRVRAQLAHEQHRREVELRHRAERDDLTGLLNRRALTERLEAAAASAAPGRATAVLFCDVDRFKAVNDVHGHAAGDQLLVQVGQRLVRSTRPDDAVGRTGGDEFVVVVEGLDGPDQVAALADRVRAELAAPFVLEGVVLDCGVTAGAAVADGPTTAGDLIARADAAMYRAKQQRRAATSAADGGRPVTAQQARALR